MGTSGVRRPPPNRRSPIRLTPITIVIVTVALVGVVFAQKAYYKSQDKSDCFRAMPGKVVDDKGEPLPWSKQPDTFKTAVEQCAEQKKNQRTAPFGSFDARANTLCEQEWADFGRMNKAGQPGLRSDSKWPTQAEAQRAAEIPKTYGIEETLDSTDEDDKKRFMTGCMLIKSRELRRTAKTRD